jgi:hypothetical protein
MIVSFTGTRRGMTDAQWATVQTLLVRLAPTEVHHGDCVGADSDFAEICSGLVPRPRIIAHPGESAGGGENHLRANSPHNDEVLPTKTHFARNRDLVNAADVLVAAPAEMERQERGGTWYTIDFAGKRKKPAHVVLPTGAAS